VWLAVPLAVVVLGVVLLVVFGVHAWSRFRRMKNFGFRAADRVSSLADDAAALGERVDTLAERSDALAVRAEAAANRS
jgi:hypothetical protein